MSPGRAQVEIYFLRNPPLLSLLFFNVILINRFVAAVVVVFVAVSLYSTARSRPLCTPLRALQSVPYRYSGPGIALDRLYKKNIPLFKDRQQYSFHSNIAILRRHTREGGFS